jgi:hypothetical protein
MRMYIQIQYDMAMANISLTDSSHYLHKLSELAHTSQSGALPEKKIHAPGRQTGSWAYLLSRRDAWIPRPSGGLRRGLVMRRRSADIVPAGAAARLPGAISPGASSKLGCRSICRRRLCLHVVASCRRLFLLPFHVVACFPVMSI